MVPDTDGAPCQEPRNPFWEKIQKIIHEVTDKLLPRSPATFLLHHTTMTLQTYTRSVIPRLLNDAKAMIHIYWKQTNTPLLTRWVEEVEATRKFEDMKANTPHHRDRYTKRWFHWTKLTTSDSFRHHLAAL
ncbi:Hypothetical predicted protein [Pelobates cultripes]|uniref:Uncharacterized protein n=1 Tax=Pelobates cultripes TaxID=61616 RepID=A0AAD1R1Z5_PELCU|nr:Hypothetical predicted protein [Pelobates cultripes]